MAAPRASSGKALAETTPIDHVVWGRWCRVVGRVESVTVKPHLGEASLECIVADPTGRIKVVLHGTRKVTGLEPGALLVVEGTVGSAGKRLAMLDPEIEVLEPGP